MILDPNALRNTTEELLRSRAVFDVDAFGWLNENDADPEFIGYVMWTLDPPYDHDMDAWQNHTPPSRAPTKTEQQLMELGHDFFGLMKTARHFIGHALLHQPAVQPLRINPTDFDFNEFAALVALTAAADRLSNFIIVTTLGRMTNENGERNRACDKLRDSGFGTEADKLQEGFKGIAKSRKDRVEVVHKLATQPARVERRLIAADREAFLEQRWPTASNRDEPYEEFLRKQKLREADELAEVEARAKLLCDCYIKLVKMGELSFRIEHNWRQLPPSDPKTRLLSRQSPNAASICVRNLLMSVAPRYRCLVSRFLWPSHACTVRSGIPCSCQRVAHVLRKRCKFEYANRTQSPPNQPE